MKEDENSACEQWFKDWFNTPYYHLLYSNRNENEAEFFLSNLLKEIHLREKSKILDLGCGKGRHSLFLYTLGMDVTGIDLSEKSIASALQHQTDTLHFYVHDMRSVLRTSYFDVVLNLFTSFGYFEREAEDIKVLKAVHDGLKKDGLFVLDYLNAEKIISSVCSEEQSITKDSIEFHWKKSIDNNFIEKEITVKDKNEVKHYKEKVKLLRQGDFRRYFEKTGFRIKKEWGNYNLQEFDPANSERYIVLAQKI